MATLKLDARHYLSDTPREVEIDEEVYEIIKLTLADVTPMSGNMLHALRKLQLELVSDHGVREDDAQTIVFSAWRAMQEERKKESQGPG